MSKILHFIGIWWIWMSALARYYLNKWYHVKWSDNENSDLIQELISQWIKVKIWHDENNIDWSEDTVYYSPAVIQNNNELRKAKKFNIKCLDYFMWVWEISKKTKCIAISWTHWKSTTTSMIWIILQEIGLKPDVIVWTKVPNFNNKNYLEWNWEYLIVEACEYKESFLNLDVYWAVILNMEADHLDYYKNERNYVKWFEKFVEKLPSNWFLIINNNDSNCTHVKKKAKCKIIEINWTKNNLDKIPELSVPWNHIKLDWLFAIEACKEIINKNKKINICNLNSKLFSAIKMFSWTWRRFEQIWEFNWAKVISDYAHHPTEISATLGWAREKYKKNNIICVFEPHQYSRTIELFHDFCNCFWDSDFVIIPSIYEVRDNPRDKNKMSAKKLAIWIDKISNNALFIDWYEETILYLKHNVKKWDIVIVMGAGPIDFVARELVDVVSS